MLFRSIGTTRVRIVECTLVISTCAGQSKSLQRSSLKTKSQKQRVLHFRCFFAFSSKCCANCSVIGIRHNCTWSRAQPHHIRPRSTSLFLNVAHPANFLSNLHYHRQLHALPLHAPESTFAIIVTDGVVSAVWQKRRPPTQGDNEPELRTTNCRFLIRFDGRWKGSRTIVIHI